MLAICASMCRGVVFGFSALRKLGIWSLHASSASRSLMYVYCGLCLPLESVRCE